MIKKWIGCFSALLLLTGSITPSVHAVTQTTTSGNQVQSSENVSESTQSNSQTETDSSTSEINESTISSTTDTTTETNSSEAQDENSVEINETNFPDEHFRQWLAENIDQEKDGVLSHELTDTKELIINEEEIESLEGITFFKNLEKLDVQKNALKELDVHSLEHLSYLDVSYNQLTDLDLSENDQLTFFAGGHQTIETKAVFSQEKWQIQDEALQPDPEKLSITSPEWQYEEGMFTSEQQVPLTYEYILDFSEKAVLDEKSDQNLSIQAEIQYEEKSPEAITPDEQSLTLAPGETKELTYTTVPEESKIKEPVWETEDPAIASVDESGVVTAVSPGQTIITLKDGESKLGTFDITVTESEETATSETTETSETSEKAAEDKKQENYTARAAAQPTISYQTHIQDIGWQAARTNGATSGTTGQRLRIEALRVNVNNTNLTGDVEYSAHVQDIGWQNFTRNNGIAGTTGQKLQMEAVRIRLTGQLKENFDIYYRVHTAEFGWLGWAKNGENAGTARYRYRMEALEIRMVSKSQSGPTTGNAFFERNLNNPTISYQTHVQDIGWQNAQVNGSTAGTTGRKLRVEALRMNIIDTTLTGDIEYSTHVQDIGWQNFVKNGDLAGTTGARKQVEAVRVRLTGQLNQFYNVYYRVHSAEFGWLGWARNGENAGSSGFLYRVEAIQVQLVPKGQSAPGGGTPFYNRSEISIPTINYQAHVQEIGWQATQQNGATAGTTGRSLRVEGLRIGVSNTPITGNIEYTAYVQDIGWQPYVRNNALAGTTGRRLRVEAARIRLTGELNRFYDVYYRVHSARFGWLGWARNDQRAGTSSLNLPMEAVQIVIVRKGAAAPGSTDTPYRTSIDHLFVMGHGVADPGATYNGVNERDFTRNELLPYLRRWADRLSQNRITFYDTNADMFQDSRRMQGAYTISSTFASVTEFHLDAGAIEISTGGHVIVHRDSNFRTEQNFAIANTIRDHVGWWGSVAQTNGLSARADLLNMNVLHSRNIPYRLAELGFITNSRDVANIRRNIDQIAKRIVEGATGESL
ncbi:N-acetylmuramoyl-L-alanine amidase [Enterococcus faecalis 13-SD-W-01]|nr:N-acetylmuramoyl-L-alanine amidase [Enterococcus faecalis 13-SD-W-01]